VQAFGLTFPNRLGLAAGYDKDGLAAPGLAALGLGHLELGTVTWSAQPGNPRPRIFRLRDQESLVNRMGFPSQGAEVLLRRLSQCHRPSGAILGVNLGKNKDTPLEQAPREYARLVAAFAPVADYLAVNISSPTTPGLRELQRGQHLLDLLTALCDSRQAQREALGRPVPLLIKLSPDLEETQLRRTLDAILEAQLDGIIAANTSSHHEAAQTGGLSGALLRARSLAFLQRVHQHTQGTLPIIGVGGIMSPEDARARLDAGATLIQVYTGLVIRGPGLVRDIVQRVG